MNYLLFMFLIVLIALILMFVLPMAKSEEIELGGTSNNINLPNIPISAVFSRQSIENPENEPYFIDLSTGNPYSITVRDRNTRFKNVAQTKETDQWGVEPTDNLRDVADKLPLGNLYYIKDADKQVIRSGLTNLKTGETIKFPTKYDPL